MNQTTQQLMDEVSKVQDDTYKTAYNAKMLAYSILSLLGDDVIQYAIYQVYRIGHKPTRTQFRKLAKFRKSETASTLYYLWRGVEYTPAILVESPTKQYRYNTPVVTVREGEAEIVLSESFMTDNPAVEAAIW